MTKTIKTTDHIAERIKKEKEYADMWGRKYEEVPEHTSLFNPEYGEVSEGLTKKC